jgi:hypothetical protein
MWSRRSTPSTVRRSRLCPEREAPAVIRKTTNGIHLWAGAVFLTLLTGGTISAQSVDRTDTPRQGELRIKFDPRMLTWSREFASDGSLRSLGAPLSGDTVGALHIPVVTRLQQDLRTASGMPGFIASIGQGLLSERAEVRVTPITAELGLTNRLSFAVTLPIVRTAIRTAFNLKAAGATLGANPLARVSGADIRYSEFFTHFAAALAQLGDSIGNGHYGCPSSPQCAQAQAALAQGQAIRDALNRTVYGVGTTGSPFVPLAGSDVGNGIDSTVVQLQRDLQNAYHVAGFSDEFLLSTDTLTSETFATFLNDSSFGFGYSPFRNSWRYGLGDLALQAKYRIGGGHYAVAIAGLVRLPTGSRDSTLEVLDIPIADHQPAFELTLTQEVMVARRLWLNLAVRAGTATGSTRARRVAPPDAFLTPYQATTTLLWDVGDYLAIDFAPMYRFTPTFALGCIAGYRTKRADHYGYESAQDSLDLADRLGAPIPASVLDEGTAQHSLRVGLAVTYASPKIEGGFTVEQTVSGGGGPVPDATVFRLVVRVDWPLF